MPQPCREWSARFAVALLLLVQGCGQKPDKGYHTYNDSVAAPEGGSGILMRGPESPPPEVPVSETPSVSEAPHAPAVVSTPDRNQKPETSVPAPKPSPIVSTTTPAPAAPVVHELALALPPPPPEAVQLALAKVGGTPLPAREIQLLIPEKDFQVEGPEGAVRVTFDDIDLLKVLNADPVPVDIEKHLPNWLSGLNGKMVRIRGWMFPPNQETDLPAFLFVRDNQICCFGRKPMVYDKFGVRLREGVTTNYIQGRPFDVVGQMVVKSRLVDGELFWLYMINDAIVIDK